MQAYTPKIKAATSTILGVFLLFLPACGNGQLTWQGSETPEEEFQTESSGAVFADAVPVNAVQTTTPPVIELGNCATNFSNNPNNACKTLAIACGGNDYSEVQVRMHYPAPTTTPMGTIVFGSGGTGTNWVYNPMNPDNKIYMAIDRLVSDGYTVVERTWTNGWWGDGQAGDGLVAPACRYVELLKWLKTNVYNQGGFCAMGNSGGSSEIAYGMTHWNAGNLLDLAVLSGGPPMGRIDYGCFYDNAPGWKNECLQMWNQFGHADECGRLDIDPLVINDPNYTDNIVSSDAACGYGLSQQTTFDAAFSMPGNTNICSTQSPGSQNYMRHESVLSPNALLSYPNTSMHFIFGKSDCTEAALLGKLYAYEVASQKTVTHLDGVVHSIWKSLDGAKRVYKTLKNGCH